MEQKIHIIVHGSINSVEKSVTTVRSTELQDIVMLRVAEHEDEQKDVEIISYNPQEPITTETLIHQVLRNVMMEI